MKILCLIGFHKWSLWTYVKPIGRYESRLKSSCVRCGKNKTYTGLIEKDIISGEYSPYIFKD